MSDNEKTFPKVVRFKDLEGPSVVCSVRGAKKAPYVDPYTICSLYNDGRHLYVRDVEAEAHTFTWVSYGHFKTMVSFVQTTKEFQVPNAHILLFRHKGHRGDLAFVQVGLVYEENMVLLVALTIPKGNVVVISEATQKQKQYRRKLQLAHYVPS